MEVWKPFDSRKAFPNVALKGFLAAVQYFLWTPVTEKEKFVKHLYESLDIAFKRSSGPLQYTFISYRKNNSWLSVHLVCGLNLLSNSTARFIFLSFSLSRALRVRTSLYRLTKAEGLKLASNTKCLECFCSYQDLLNCGLF